jgi:hypothetical protein
MVALAAGLVRQTACLATRGARHLNGRFRRVSCPTNGPQQVRSGMYAAYFIYLLHSVIVNMQHSARRPRAPEVQRCGALFVRARHRRPRLTARLAHLPWTKT